MSQSAHHPFLGSFSFSRIGARRMFRALVVSGPFAAWFDCAVLLAVAGAVRSIGLPALPIWFDDLFTVYWSQLPLDFLFGQGAQSETNPPLYYGFMHLWMMLFGDSPASVYVPAAVISAATVPLVYLTAAVLFDRRTALLAGLFAAVDPFMVEYGQQVRAYALLGFLEGAAMLAMAAYLQGRRAPPGLMKWRVLFVTAISAATFVHYTAFLFLSACFVVVALELLIARPSRWQYLLTWGGLAIATAACVAWPAWQAAHLTSAPNLDWIPSLSPEVAWYFLESVLLYTAMPFGWQSFALCGLFGVVMATALWRIRQMRPAVLLLAVLPALFCAILFAVTAVRPILLPRIGIWLPMPVCILLAAGVMRQPAWLRWPAGLVVLAGLVFALCSYVHKPGIEDWRLAARIAATQPACSGPLVTFNTDALGLFYYQPDLQDRPLFAIPMDITEKGFRPRPIEKLQQDTLERAYLHADFMYLRQLPAFIAARPHTFLVMRLNYSPLLRVLPRPTVAGVLPGGVVVACY